MIDIFSTRHGKLTGIYNEPPSFSELGVWIGLTCAYFTIVGLVAYLIIK